MPAARGLKRTASKADSKSSAGSSKIKKKPEAKAPAVSEELEAPGRRGQVFTTGSGDVGQLGLGEDHLEKCRFTHVKVLPPTIVDICAGGMHTVALDKDGNVWTFGCNDEGALGRDSEGGGTEWEPARVQLPGRAVGVSAGDSHTAALLSTKRVFAWGSFRDSHGNMGLTLKGNERRPVEMLPGHKVVQIASGGDHLVMLTEQGKVFTCGCGEQGQLGRVTARSCDRHSRLGLSALLQPAPLVFCRDKADFEAVWAGSHCTFARRAVKGDIYVWGLNNYQQIGVRKGSPQTVFTPVISEAFAALEGDRRWTSVAAGPHHTLALDDAGRCYSLGRREYGRLGLGKDCEDATELTPVPALEGKRCVSISCGTAASFAVTDQGEVLSWGMGTSGQLGTGGEEDEAEPRAPPRGLEGRTALLVSAGGQHTVLLVVTPQQEEMEQEAKAAPSTLMEVDTPHQEADSEETDMNEKNEEEDKKPRKAPAAGKRGRKGSSASVESKPSAPAKKQNGGSPVPEETEPQAPEEENVNPPIQPQENEKSEAETIKRPASDDIVEPQSKRVKLDSPEKESQSKHHTDPEPEPQASTGTQSMEVSEEEEKTAAPVIRDIQDTIPATENTIANGNGNSDDAEVKDEIKVKDVEMKVMEVAEVVEVTKVAEVEGPKVVS